LLLTLYKAILDNNNTNEIARELYNKQLLRRREYRSARHFIVRYVFFIATNSIDLEAYYCKTKVVRESYIINCKQERYCCN